MAGACQDEAGAWRGRAKGVAGAWRGRVEVVAGAWRARGQSCVVGASVVRWSAPPSFIRAATGLPDAGKHVYWMRHAQIYHLEGRT